MDLYKIRKQLNMGMPLTSIKLKVTDYARVSTDHLEQKKSLQNQIEHFEKYIKENPNWTYVKGYVDEGITGISDVKRDKFMQMIEDAKQGKFDLIVTKEISRFSRNTLDSIKYTRELLSYGVAVLFVNDNINTALPDAELRLTIMASMAQDEIRRLSERVKFGMNRAIERGEILGNDLLYGYKKDKKTGFLKKIEKEAKIVRKIYELYVIEEWSLSKIAKLLNNTENSKYKWHISTISRMIENPKYKGYYCGKKTEIIDYMTKERKNLEKENWIIYKDKKRIPPIIEEELWERANNRLISRKIAFQKRKHNKNIYKNRYLYSAKIFCSEHNQVFHRREFRRNKKDVTWVCAEYLKNGKKNCDSPNIRESELNVIIKDIIESLQIKENKIIEYLMYYYKKVEIDKQQNILQYNRQIKKIYTNKEKLLQLNLENCLSSKEFKIQNERCNKKLKDLQKQIKKGKEKEEDNICKKLEGELQNKINQNSVVEKMISKILDHIVVSKIENNKNNIKLNIFLNYPIVNKNFLQKNYTFKRGYDTLGTKRYEIQYQVNYFQSKS